MKIEGIRELFRFEGFIIDKITCSSGFAQIAVHRDRRRKLRCLHCGQADVAPFQTQHRAQILGVVSK